MTASTTRSPHAPNTSGSKKLEYLTAAAAGTLVVIAATVAAPILLRPTANDTNADNPAAAAGTTPSTAAAGQVANTDAIKAAPHSPEQCLRKLPAIHLHHQRHPRDQLRHQERSNQLSNNLSEYSDHFIASLNLKEANRTVLG
ncbi:hypothetical protein G9U53_24690 [Rhodococcus sp. D-46]|uniref:hypothetical protein n=1 Tax=Rhodococcus TaxID=1827 RepID=UPI0013F5CAF7|nr:hypothetical protein [Rhodococcus qingshengii]NHE67524.1 hypothetical protein [Rhodococcus sp. D-46]QXC46562.1 hypothetical protein KSE96_30430 [Rhodococcus qingshengii]